MDQKDTEPTPPLAPGATQTIQMVDNGLPSLDFPEVELVDVTDEVDRANGRTPRGMVYEVSLPTQGASVDDGKDTVVDQFFIPAGNGPRVSIGGISLRVDETARAQLEANLGAPRIEQPHEVNVEVEMTFTSDSLIDQIRSGEADKQAMALAFVMGALVEHVDGDYCPILGCPVCADKAAGVTPIGGWTDFRMRVTGISEGKLTVERVPTSWKIPEVPATEWTLGVPGKIRQAFPSSWANASPQICGKPMEHDARSRCVLPKGHELDDFDVTTCPKEHEYQLDVESILRPERITCGACKQPTAVKKNCPRCGDVCCPCQHSTPAQVAAAARALTTAWLCTPPSPERLAIVHLVDLVVSRFMELPGNDTGGQLHVVLDDTNIETKMIRLCAESATVAGDDTALAVAGLLLAMTFEERQKLANNCPCGCLPLVDEV